MLSSNGMWTGGLAVAELLLGASPGAAKAHYPACLVQREAAAELNDEARAPKWNRPVSDDTAATLAPVRAMGPGVGGLSNPQAEAPLGQLAAFMESDTDADSQAAAAMVRERIGGAQGPASSRAARAPECAG
jgi:hypothetical protein